MDTTFLRVDEIEYVKELYPRLKPDDTIIERYRSCIEKLPPIIVARNHILVDGYHRWQAHRRDGIETIQIIDLGNLSDTEIFNESLRRNSGHGHQLSQKDKEMNAAKVWRNVSHLPIRERITHISELLSVSERTVETWTKDVRAEEKKEQQAKAWDMWLDCYSEREIAESIGVKQQTVSDWITEKRKDSEIGNPPDSRQHFDIWQFQTSDKDAGAQSYFGALPPQIVENLLWFYTEPGDTVVDLFAGSGTTVDVAKKMGRRIWASDIRGNHYSPHLPIHEHDVTCGWDKSAPKAKLVVLDPPYWKQATGRYSNLPGEMAEMELEAFYDAWNIVIKSCISKTDRIAYIISPTQNEDGTVVDHATDMLQAAWKHKFKVERRIIVPYQTQQATGQQVTWARDNQKMLKLYRDLVILSR